MGSGLWNRSLWSNSSLSRWKPRNRISGHSLIKCRGSAAQLPKHRPRHDQDGNHRLGNQTTNETRKKCPTRSRDDDYQRHIVLRRRLLLPFSTYHHVKEAPPHPLGRCRGSPSGLQSAGCHGSSNPSEKKKHRNSMNFYGLPGLPQPLREADGVFQPRQLLSQLRLTLRQRIELEAHPPMVASKHLSLPGLRPSG